ncbi:MAG: histidinol-phosphate transaminase [Clostridiales bacterium]|nr:histidinol-phosphate transaminase [Clostridiales bacterium]
MRLWEDKVRKVVPYTPGEQPKIQDIIKLNTNENPYPPAAEVKTALENLDADNLRLYPDPAITDLTQELARYYGLDFNQVFVGVGSDDVLAMAFMTFFNSNKPILFPDISYSFYDVWADLFKIPYVRPALKDDFHMDEKDYDRENGGIIFPNPNAPTGLAENLEFIENILKNNQDVIVIVDEAYVDFGTESAVSLIDKYENLLVVQTFSKSRSMAGMRIGYAMGNADLIKALSDVKYAFNSYTMSTPAIKLGIEAVKDDAYFRKNIEKIIRTREDAKVKLKELGFKFGDSKANFIFVTHPNYNAFELFEYLKTQKIYVRHFKANRINDYLRITIGTDEQMEKLYKALREKL